MEVRRLSARMARGSWSHDLQSWVIVRARDTPHPSHTSHFTCHPLGGPGHHQDS